MTTLVTDPPPVKQPILDIIFLLKMVDTYG